MHQKDGRMNPLLYPIFLIRLFGTFLQGLLFPRKIIEGHELIPRYPQTADGLSQQFASINKIEPPKVELSTVGEQDINNPDDPHPCFVVYIPKQVVGHGIVRAYIWGDKRVFVKYID